MGILDIFFKREAPEKVVKPEKLLPSEQIAMREGSATCDYCGGEIYSHEPRKKISGKLHHIKCFKQIKKYAKKFTFG